LVPQSDRVWARCLAVIYPLNNNTLDLMSGLMGRFFYAVP
jgi:hypothetical protein